jgi:hypothetical protein
MQRPTSIPVTDRDVLAALGVLRAYLQGHPSVTAPVAHGARQILQTLVREYEGRADASSKRQGVKGDAVAAALKLLRDTR